MIYFIESQGLVKIGFSDRPGIRFSKIQSDNPHPCVVLGIMDGGLIKEISLHERFKSLRQRGEWFALSEDLKAYIEENSTPPAPTKPEPTDPIGKWMRRNGSTDRHLAGLMGVSQAQVHRVRHGKSAPSWGFVRALYETTGVTPNDLMGIRSDLPSSKGKVTAQDLYQMKAEAAQ